MLYSLRLFLEDLSCLIQSVKDSSKNGNMTLFQPINIMTGYFSTDKSKFSFEFVDNFDEVQSSSQM